ncbi:MAG: putative thiol:disulfide interchange protein DsbC precursor [Pseudomonadota bacterium]|jgi:thiol:disulfide interchange protein DsbC
MEPSFSGRAHRAVVAALAAACVAALPALAVAQAPAPAAPASVAPAASAGDPSAAIRASVENWLQGRFKVDGLRRSPVAGIWEVQIGSDLIYVDDKGQHGFVEGQLIDLKANRNLTQERIDEITAVSFKDLPLAWAIKQVNGKGTRQVAVFEDPNCGHCRNLRRDLLNVPDVTIYTFPLPILAADSKVKAAQAWCASDRVKAWNELMLQGKVPDNKGTCDNPVEKVAELGRKLKITGTPTLFFANGKRLPGGVPAARLNKLIDENSKAG